ncbi:MAG: hypothetical protein WC473_05025 [Patescibacteria group bacterium]|jgi:hypothetical protein
MNIIFLKLRQLVEESPAKRDRLVSGVFVAAAVFDLLSLAAILLYFWRFKEFVVLQYNIYFGISSFGSWQYLLFLPLLGWLICLVNFLLALKVYLRDRKLSYFLSFAALASSLIIATQIGLLVYMNL